MKIRFSINIPKINWESQNCRHKKRVCHLGSRVIMCLTILTSWCINKGPRQKYRCCMGVVKSYRYGREEVVILMTFLEFKTKNKTFI